jgi:hypothetical protein
MVQFLDYLNLNLILPENFDIKVQNSKETHFFYFVLSFAMICTASFVYDFHAAPLVDFFNISSGKTNQKKTRI